jgi:hypothetical protein
MQGEDGDDTNMVAEILLQFKENLSVHPGKRYTTRTVTGARLCSLHTLGIASTVWFWSDSLQKACVGLVACADRVPMCAGTRAANRKYK